MRYVRKFYQKKGRIKLRISFYLLLDLGQISKYQKEFTEKIFYEWHSHKGEGSLKFANFQKRRCTF